MFKGLQGVCRRLIGAANKNDIKYARIAAKAHDANLKADLCNRIAQLTKRVVNLEGAEPDGVAREKCSLCGKYDFIENLEVKEDGDIFEEVWLHPACRVSTPENKKKFDRRKK